jgi:uncharacterized membrane protein YkoI
MRAQNLLKIVVTVVALAAVPEARQIVAVAPANAQQPARPAQAGTSLAQAVRVAEQQTGGRARRAEMERERGVYLYEIKTVSKDTSAKVLLDPTSGNVLRVDTPWFPAFDDDKWKDQAAFTRLEASSMRLADAIDAAEKSGGGRAVKAEWRDQYGMTVFVVQLFQEGLMQRVHVDPASGKVVAVPGRGKKGKDDDD